MGTVHLRGVGRAIASGGRKRAMWGGNTSARSAKRRASSEKTPPILHLHPSLRSVGLWRCAGIEYGRNPLWWCYVGIGRCGPTGSRPLLCSACLINSKRGRILIFMPSNNSVQIDQPPLPSSTIRPKGDLRLALIPIPAVYPALSDQIRVHPYELDEMVSSR